MTETRVCPKCREEKELTGENWATDQDYKCGFYTASCKKCINARRVQRGKVFSPDQIERRKEATAKWKAEHPQKLRDYKAKYQKSNPEKHKKESRDYYRAYPERSKAARLSDCYVRMLLRKSGVPISTTPEIVEAKREQLQLHRLIKEIQKETNVWA